MAYTKITDYAAKDALPSGNSGKLVKGTELGAEFDSIQVADADNMKKSAMGTGVETFLGTPSSANLAAAVTGETGSGALVFATSPTLVTPNIGVATGTSLAVTTLDSTNLEVTNLKAKDGTAAGSIADSTGVVTIASSVLTTTDINAGTIDNTVIGGTTKAAGSFTTLTSTGNAALGDAEATDTHAIKGATTLLANSASAALTVTQTGAGNALVVEDSTSPDATPFIITGDGLAVGGHTSSLSITAGVTPRIQIHEATVIASEDITSWANDSNPPSVKFAKAKSGVIGTYTAPASGESVGRIRYYGADGSAFVETARVEAAIDGTPGSGDMPGRLVFYTTADGASSVTERMRIDSAGNIFVGTGALATTATDGFLYIPTCAGTPTGVPTAKTGLVPLVFDSTNNKLYVYDGSWLDMT